MRGFLYSSGGRKFVMGNVALLLSCLALGFDYIDAAQWVDLMKWSVGLTTVTIAAEESVKSLGKGGGA